MRPSSVLKPMTIDDLIREIREQVAQLEFPIVSAPLVLAFVDRFEDEIIRLRMELDDVRQSKATAKTDPLP
jgi:hypothetical protein